jgi:hypothetical protein
MCDVSKVSAQGDTVIKDTDEMFMRAMLRMVDIVRPGSLSTFKPPAHCRDCGLGVASQDWSFRNITPRSRKVCRSTDYTRQSTDCTSLATDCYNELTVKNGLPDVAVLTEDKTVCLANWGEDIVGSVRRRPAPGDAAVTRPEVVGLHACQLQSTHGGPD